MTTQRGAAHRVDSRARLGGAVGLLLLGAACTPSRGLALPEPGPGAMLLVTLLEDGSGQVAGVAPAAERPAPALSLGSSHRVFALVYQDSLEALLVPAGPIPSLAPGEAGRSLPVASVAYEALGDPRNFEAVDSELAQAALAGVQLPSIANDACERRGGCYRPHQRNLICSDDCEPVTVRPPQPPAPPVLPTLPCLPGWSDRGRSRIPGLVVCEPPDTVACPAGSGQFIDRAECEALAPCPAGDWPEDPPPDAIYVQAGAVAGDGSRAQPFGDLAVALARAAPPATLVLSKGLHRANVELPGGVGLLGACPRDTTIEGAASNLPTLTARGRDNEVRGLTLRGGAYAVRIAGDAEALLEAVELGGAPLPALVELGGRMVIRRARINGGPLGSVKAQTGAELRLERVVVIQDQGAGPSLDGAGTQGIIEDLVVHADPNGPIGAYGLVTNHQAHLEARRVLIDGLAASGISTFDGATSSVSDALVRYPPGAQVGHGIDLYQGELAFAPSRVKLERVVVLDVPRHGIFLNQFTNQLQGEDVYVSAAKRIGLYVVGGQVEVQRLALEDNLGGGALLANCGADLRDLWVSGTDVAPTGEAGDGVAVSSATVSIARAQFEDNRWWALRCLQLPGGRSRVDLSDATIRYSMDDAQVVPSIVIQGQASLVAARVSIESSAARAIEFLNADPSVLDDLRITRARLYGISAVRTPLMGHSIAIEDSLCAGMRLVSGTFELSEVLVDNTLGVTCPQIIEGPDKVDLPGSGLLISTDQPLPGEDTAPPGQLSLQHFLIRRQPTQGLAIGSGATVALEDGAIADCRRGINTRNLDLGLGDLPESVRFQSITEEILRYQP